MIKEKKILAIIPARGGSKGVSRKNIRNVGGKPLIAWTIQEARKSKYIDRLIVSTDDPEIADISRHWGGETPFIRPAELAQDDTPGIAPVLHAIETLKEQFDIIVLLQATSPLRNVDDIDGCIVQLLETGNKSCVSVVIPDKSPYWMYQLDTDKKLTPVLNSMFYRRQDIPTVYALNGAVYVAECAWLKENKSFIADDTIGYIMPKERSIDIDSETDLSIVEYFLYQLIKATPNTKE